MRRDGPRQDGPGLERDRVVEARGDLARGHGALEVAQPAEHDANIRVPGKKGRKHEGKNGTQSLASKERKRGAGPAIAHGVSTCAAARVGSSASDADSALWAIV